MGLPVHNNRMRHLKIRAGIYECVAVAVQVLKHWNLAFTGNALYQRLATSRNNQVDVPCLLQQVADGIPICCANQLDESAR